MRSTGSYSVVDLTSLNVFKDIKIGGVNSDAIARFVPAAAFVNPSAFPSWARLCRESPGSG